MAEEIAFENDRIFNVEGLVTLTLDRVTLHIVVHHSSTSTYMPHFIEIKETFRGRTNGRTSRTHARTDRQTFETGFLRSTLLNSRPKTEYKQYIKPSSSIIYIATARSRDIAMVTDLWRILAKIYTPRLHSFRDIRRLLGR